MSTIVLLFIHHSVSVSCISLNAIRRKILNRKAVIVDSSDIYECDGMNISIRVIGRDSRDTEEDIDSTYYLVIVFQIMNMIPY